MQYPWINGGRAFVPQTTLRDLLEVRREARESQRPGVEEDVESMVAWAVRILQRTDPSLTREHLLDLIAPWELEPLFRGLWSGPEAAAPPGPDAPSPTPDSGPSNSTAMMETP